MTKCHKEFRQLDALQTVNRFYQQSEARYPDNLIEVNGLFCLKREIVIIS